jgi:hypothetical protein
VPAALAKKIGRRLRSVYPYSCQGKSPKIGRVTATVDGILDRFPQVQIHGERPIYHFRANYRIRQCLISRITPNISGKNSAFGLRVMRRTGGAAAGKSSVGFRCCIVLLSHEAMEFSQKLVGSGKRTGLALRRRPCVHFAAECSAAMGDRYTRLFASPHGTAQLGAAVHIQPKNRAIQSSHRNGRVTSMGRKIFSATLRFALRILELPQFGQIILSSRTPDYDVRITSNEQHAQYSPLCSPWTLLSELNGLESYIYAVNMHLTQKGCKVWKP